MDKSWEFISSGHLVALRWRREYRTVRGYFNVAPKLFVVTREDKRDEMQIAPISFEAAATLAPEAFVSLVLLLDAARDRDQRKERDERNAREEASAACREFVAA